MQNSTAFKFAPVYSDEQKIDLALENNQAVIKLSSWVEGLGWCCQKTMLLDANMLDEMHRVIAAARVKLKAENSTDGGSMDRNVLSFPGSNA